MKKLIVILSFVMAATSVAFAQDATAVKTDSQTEKETVKNSHAPYMEFDKMVHDYGVIMENSDGGCEFTLTNTGKEPLILSDCKSSCGCTVPEWTKAPVLPGQSTVIKVQYKTSRIGPINKSITITSNASNSPQTVRIKGEVRKDSDNQAVKNNVEGGASPVAAPNK